MTDPGDPNTPLVTRNYVWGPGYVDEILARRDDVPSQPARLYFLLQDANFNTVALLAPGGAVLAQWQYAPYGQVVAYEADPNAPVTRLGFRSTSHVPTRARREPCLSPGRGQGGSHALPMSRALRCSPSHVSKFPPSHPATATALAAESPPPPPRIRPLRRYAMHP